MNLIIKDIVYPDHLIDKILQSIESENNMDNKIHIICNHLKELAGSSFISTDMEIIFQIMIKRLNIIMDYIQDRKDKLSAFKNVFEKRWMKKSGNLFIISTISLDQFINLEDSNNANKNKSELLSLKNVIKFILYKHVF